MQVAVLAITGPSGSGKSTLAQRLHRRFTHSHATLIQQDDFFKGPKSDTYWNCGDLDNPDVVDFPKFTRTIQRAIDNAPDNSIVIIEGFLLLLDQTILDQIHVLFFLAAPRDICLQRRLVRSTRSAHEHEGLRRYYLSTVWPNYQIYTEKALNRLVENSNFFINVLDVSIVSADKVEQVAMRTIASTFPLVLFQNSNSSMHACIAVEMADWAEMNKALPALVQLAAENAMERCQIGLAIVPSADAYFLKLGNFDSFSSFYLNFDWCEATSHLCRLLRNVCVHEPKVQQALAERPCLLNRIEMVASAAAAVDMAIEEDRLVSSFYALAAISLQVLSNAVSSSPAGKRVLWQRGSLLMKSLLRPGSGSSVGHVFEMEQKIKGLALAVLFNCTVGEETRLRDLVQAASGIVAQDCPHEWLACIIWLQSHSSGRRHNDWGHMLIRAIAFAGDTSALLDAAGRLPIQTVTSRRDEEEAPTDYRAIIAEILESLMIGSSDLRDRQDDDDAQLAGAAGPKLVEALFPLLAAASDRNWWQSSNSSHELLVLTRTAGWLATRDYPPFERCDDGDDVVNGVSGIAVKLLTVLIKTLEEMHRWRPPLGLNQREVQSIDSQDTLSIEVEMMRLIANLLYRRKCCQTAIRQFNGIGTVLQRCRVDERNPLMREWSIFAVRNLCENCVENQDVIAQLEQLSKPELSR